MVLFRSLSLCFTKFSGPNFWLGLNAFVWVDECWIRQVIVHFIGWRNPTSFNPFKFTRWSSSCGGHCHHVGWWSHLCANKGIYVCCIVDEHFQVVTVLLVLTYRPITLDFIVLFRFIGLFWSKGLNMSGWESNERMKLVFLQVIVNNGTPTPSLLHHHMIIPDSLGLIMWDTYHCNGLVILNSICIQLLKYLYLHHIWKTSSNHLFVLRYEWKLDVVLMILLVFVLEHGNVIALLQ